MTAQVAAGDPFVRRKDRGVWRSGGLTQVKVSRRVARILQQEVRETKE
jgi:hypothetical protein